MVPGVLLAIACAGCGFKGAQSSPGDADAADAIVQGDAPDAADAAVADGVDAPTDGLCVSFSQLINTCALTFGDDLPITGPGTAQYNTETGVLSVNGTLVPVTHRSFTIEGVTIDAILAHNVTLTMGIALQAFGGAPLGASKPIAIIASGTVTLDDGAQIDVSDGGAGAFPVCSTPPRSGSSVAPGIGGGGGGGGFASKGGQGGLGNSDGPSTAAGGDGAASIGAAGPQGGCAGAAGGTGSGGTVGAGGKGGGAIYIAAAGRIQLGNGAMLQAGGGGGHGGTHRSLPDFGDAGGGGGGSGGMILLEAPQIVAPTAGLFANGGGGGEGSITTDAGNDGQPGQITTTAARGGNGGPAEGGDGGDGGALASPQGENAPAPARRGGGGGGGSAGYIFLLSPDRQLSANVSPAPRFSL